MLIIFFAKSATQLLVALGVISAGAISSALMPAAILLACAVIFGVLRRGATGVSMVSNILVAHVFVGLWMLYLLVSHRWPELIAARPAQATADHMFNYTTGIELGIATGLGWWPYVGAMIRMAPNARAIVIPVLLGMGASVPLLSLIGLAGVLVLKSSNPAEWLRTVGGTTYAIISLAFVTAANFGTAIVGIYASAIGLRNFATLQRCRWSTLLFITIMPIAIIGVTIPDLFFDRFGSFLALIALVFAPLCGIQIADYFFLRRRKIDIRAIYDNRAEALYFFWGGVNPAAIVAILAGCSAYIALLNPLTYESSHLYRYVTASLPSAVIAALTYVIASRLVIATGRGGYP